LWTPFLLLSVWPSFVAHLCITAPPESQGLIYHFGYKIVVLILLYINFGNKLIGSYPDPFTLV
jgi:hypothetical protein